MIKNSELIRRNLFKLAFFLVLIAVKSLSAQTTDVDHIKRGLVAVKDGSSGIYVGWRLLVADPADVAFNLYRIADGGSGEKLNDTPIIGSTNYFDESASLTSSNQYFVKPVSGGTEQESSDTVAVWSQNYLTVPLQRPSGGTTPDGGGYTYEPNDMSTADLDGDGEYELILKWYPSNAKDNAQAGYTGNMILDAYEMDGTRLWRIDFGVNIRSGAHYGPFMVYDLDGDGIAEVVARTAPGSKDGSGNFLSDGPASSANHSADYRNNDGYILTGPEYLSVFDGRDGTELETVNLEPNRGNVSDWGDNYGNRVDRLTAAVAYLDGNNPSVLWCRGIYTKIEIAAYDWDGSKLTQRWIFRSGDGYPDWYGMGSHNLSVGDVDSDGKDELVYGHCAIDDDGTGLWSLKSEIGTSTGDAMHLADIIPERPGLERWACGEYSNSGSHLVDAGTGEIIWKTPAGDVGRATAADLVEEFYGMECWGGTDELRSAHNEHAGPWPSSTNHVVWWDADLGRELLNGNTIDKYNQGRLLTADGCYSNNGSKSNPCLQADIFGDWREEVIWRTANNNAIRIYTTTAQTEYRLKTLMHDRQYRLAIAWQNNSYNQPPHTSFYLGYDMFTPLEEIPPSPPGSVDVETGAEFFTLNWGPNKEFDLQGYNVYKSTSGAEFVKLNESLLSNTEFLDPSVAMDILYKYYITAVDNDGNESEPSAMVNALSINRPEAPSIIKTSRGTGKILVYWNPVDAAAEKAASLKTQDKSVQYENLILKHAYTFADGTATDTVAGANGSAMGGSFANGAFVADANGEYIQLPAAQIAINTYSSITMEAYIVSDVDNEDATMLSYFGGNANGVGGNGYFMTPDRWEESRTAISCGNLASPWESEDGVTGQPVSVGERHHVVSILTDSTISFYIDGNQVGKSEITGSNSISNLSNANAWLCRGGYNSDPSWMGSLHEFNIYEGVMDEETIVARSVIFPYDIAGDKDKIIGYNVYASDEPGSGFIKINDELVTDTAFVHENLINGAPYYYLVNSVDGALRESYFPDEVSAIPDNIIFLQAEDAEYKHVSIESNYAGFRGSGFADFNAEGYVRFDHVFSKESAWFNLVIRYALGTDARTGHVVVNDSTFNFTMESTDSWTKYQSGTAKVYLNPDFDNTILFQATGADFGNLDEIIVGPKTTVPTTTDNLQADGLQSFNAYPNPFSSFTYLDLRFPGNARTSIRIFDIYGRELNILNVEEAGVNHSRFRLDASDLNPGMYFATVFVDGRAVKTIKLALKN